LPGRACDSLREKQRLAFIFAASRYVVRSQANPVAGEQPESAQKIAPALDPMSGLI
jgi:hypothetical protein